MLFFFFFKQKTAYELRISDWSSYVCSSDLQGARRPVQLLGHLRRAYEAARARHQLEVARLQLQVNGAAGEASLLQAARHLLAERQMGRASCRERVCPYV